VPETIDGVQYPTTPVIAAGTNTPAGGNRPYPTAASPGKALWQLLKRYADELDNFEKGPLKTLFDNVAALSQAVNATSMQRRLFTLQQLTNLPASTVTRMPWLRDVPAGDPDNPPAGTPGIVMASDGLITVGLAGLYRVSLRGMSSNGGVNIAIRRVSDNYVYAVWGGADAPQEYIEATMVLAANAQIEIVANNRTASAAVFPNRTPSSDLTTSSPSKPTLSILRLSA
jgi:hypothetical protein